MIYIISYIDSKGVEHKLQTQTLKEAEFYGRKIEREQPNSKMIEITEYNGKLIRRIK